MNMCIVVGRVGRYPAKIFTSGQNKVLVCTVDDEKTFPNGKKFTERFKVVMYGKGLEELCQQLQPGTLVSAHGDISLDKPREGSNTTESSLKIFGQIKLLEKPKEATKQNEPAQEDDQPY